MRKDFARYDWDSMAPIGAQTVAAEAGMTLVHFCGKESFGCGRTTIASSGIGLAQPDGLSSVAVGKGGWR